MYSISYEGISRRETPRIPVEALRESLMNAVAQKDYSDATPIQISVYPNHIVFWNPGRLPENWTTARLFEKHPSKPYNPSVANTLFRCGDIESWGRGYKRIIDAVQTHKLLPPVVEILSGLMITYYSDIHSQLKVLNLDERQIKIIEFTLKNGRITNADVQELLKTNRTSAYRVLQQMDNWLEMQGKTGKSTYYVLKQTLHKRARTSNVWPYSWRKYSKNFQYDTLGYRHSNDAVRVHVEPEDAVKRSTPTTSGNQYKVQGSADLPNPFPRYLPAKRQG